MHKQYEKAKSSIYYKYKQIGEVYCPHLKQDVRFNSNGFRHLIYKNNKIKRDRKTQLLRFKLVLKAVKLIAVTTTVQEEDSYKSIVRATAHGIRVACKKKVLYRGFIAIIDGWKIKVIVKKIGNGSYFFWSVIPNWVTNRKRDKGKRYVNFTSDMEKD